MRAEILQFSGLAPEPVQAAAFYEKSLHGDEAMERLCNVLRAAQSTEQRLAALGIEKDVVADTLSDIGIWADAYKRRTGRWGIDEEAYGWLQNHLGGRLFRIGRLQCCPARLKQQWNIRVFRSKETGAVIALPAEKTQYRGDGQVSGTNGISAEADGFLGFSRNVVQGGKEYVEGTVLSPLGHALPEVVRLKKEIWEECVTQGTSVLEIHVPEGPGYSVEQCRAAFVGMRRFIAKHKHAIHVLCGIEGPFVSFCLGSWLLDAQLERLLPGNTALVQCLREYYLIPVLSDAGPTLQRVFGTQEVEPSSAGAALQQTSLQRAILSFMQEGGCMRYNLGFVLVQDAERFGTGCYRRGFELFARDHF